MKVELVLAVMAAVMAAAMAATRCPVCDVDACPKLTPGNCLAGTTKDHCGCCDVCAKLEGQPCNIDRNDECGDGLSCRDETKNGAICQCRFQEIVCGSDNKTYSNLCQLMAAGVRNHQTNTLQVKASGPCEPGATIVTKPEYVRNHSDSNVVLQCEAMGKPSPSMAWVFTRADNKTFNLPGDDCKLVTSSRGGPGKFMVTSWLQIEGLQKFHEGDYTCMAFNTHHSDKATARIKVVVP